MSPEKIIVHQNKMAASSNLSRNVTHVILCSLMSEMMEGDRYGVGAGFN